MEKNLYTQAEHDLILVNANCICNKFRNAVRDPKELFYTGYMALLDAKTHYQTGRGAKFKTYASRCIYNAMLKELAQLHNVVNVPEKQCFEVKYVEYNENPYCKEPLEDSIGENNSWECPVGEDPVGEDPVGEDNAWEDSAWEDSAWEDSAWEWDLWENDWEEKRCHQRVETLDRLLGQLNPGDRELIQRRYGIGGAPWTLKQLGEARGVSLQAVHKKLNSIEQGLHDSLCRQCA